MNRHRPLFVALLVGLTSCSSTYRVKRVDLDRPPAIIPAVAEDGRDTWISSEAAQNPRETELPAYVNVDVLDKGKTYLAIGGGIAACGLLGVIAGLAVLKAPDKPDDAPFGNVGKLFKGVGIMSLGGVVALTGGAVVLSGFLTGPPETDQPAPQAAVAIAPPRR